MRENSFYNINALESILLESMNNDCFINFDKDCFVLKSALFLNKNPHQPVICKSYTFLSSVLFW